jgi:hypothetical protein
VTKHSPARGDGIGPIRSIAETSAQEQALDFCAAGPVFGKGVEVLETGFGYDPLGGQQVEVSQFAFAVGPHHELQRFRGGVKQAIRDRALANQGDRAAVAIEYACQPVREFKLQPLDRRLGGRKLGFRLANGPLVPVADRDGKSDLQIGVGSLQSIVVLDDRLNRNVGQRLNPRAVKGGRRTLATGPDALDFRAACP